MPGPDPRGICHYPAVVPEVLGHLACCFPGGVPNALCGLQILQHAEHAVLRPGLGATELWKSRIDLANGTVRPELGHFQGLKLTECWRSSISFLELSSWTRQLCVYSGLALSGVNIQFSLEDPFIPAPLFHHTLAKQGGGEEPLGFLFLLDNITHSLSLDLFLAFIGPDPTPLSCALPSFIF